MEYWLIIIALLWLISSYLYRTSTFKVDPKEYIRNLEEQLALKQQEYRDSFGGKIAPKPKHRVFVPYSDCTPDLAPYRALIFISAEEKLAYMLTKEWTELKKLRLVIADYKCECCGSATQLHLHHITYVRLTQELLSDVSILCSNCHTKLHNTRGYDRTTLYPISAIKD